MGRSESSEIAQENRIKKYLKSYIVVANLIPEDSILSEPTKDLLRRMLVIDESRRLKWDELFNHKAIRID